MLKEAENIVKVEGILAETDLKYGSYTKMVSRLRRLAAPLL